MTEENNLKSEECVENSSCKKCVSYDKIKKICSIKQNNNISENEVYIIASLENKSLSEIFIAEVKKTQLLPINTDINYNTYMRRNNIYSNSYDFNNENIKCINVMYLKY